MAALERHERRRVVGAEPVEVGAVLAAQVQEVLEAGRRDEGGAGAARSSSALVAIVVPWVKRSTLVAPSASTAASTDSSCRVAVGTFAVRTPFSSSENRVGERPAHVDPEKGHGGL